MVWSAESPDGSSYIIVGWMKNADGIKNQGIWKLNPSNGEVVWYFNFASGHKSDALETVQFTPDGGIVVGGYVNGDNEGSPGKSAGQQSEANPFIAKLSAASIAGTEEPAGYEWFWYETDVPTYKGSAKAIRVDQNNGDIYANFGRKISVIKLDSTGNVLAKSKAFKDKWAMQGSDLEIAPDGGIIVGGLAHTGGQKAAIMKLDPNTLDIVWQKIHGGYPGGVNQYKGLDGGNRRYVIDECWGLMTTTDANGVPTGYALGCGTGIEGCPDVPGYEKLKAECEADPRIEWRSLVVATDLNGDMTWYRIDNF